MTASQRALARIGEWLHRLALTERRCPVCLTPHTHHLRHPLHGPGDAAVCADCARSLPRRTGGFCPRCGELSPVPALPCTPCSHCLKTPPPWQEFRFHGVYEGMLRSVLLRAKFQGDSTAADLAGRLLAAACADLPRPDAIVPVPLHTHRLRTRGCNQCTELARPIAAILSAPLHGELLLRTVPTQPQTGLDRALRQRNLRNAFKASPACRGLHLLLVDDTMTTGTTLARAAACLQKAGAARVDVAVVARTPRHFI